MANEENLESLFDSHFTLELLVVHEELDQVEELPWLLVLVVADAALVHRLVLCLAHFAIEVVIHLPDDGVYL